MAPLKVIGGGYGRTGTDSLRTALNMLGYRTHHMKSFFEDPTQRFEKFYNAYQDKEHADYDKLYENYDAAVDWPSVSFYQELLAAYPDAKVVLTVRSAESWYKSVKNTIHKAAVHSASPEHDEQSRKFGVMVNALCMDGLLSDPERFGDEEAVKKLFDAHTEEVKQHVPADQLLVMELGEGWDRLCKFLGKEVPKDPYPSINSTTEFQQKMKGIDVETFIKGPKAA